MAKDMMEQLAKLDQDLKRASRMMEPREARYTVDCYYQIQEFRKAAANQTRANDEQAEPNALLQWFEDSTRRLEGNIKKALGEFAGAYRVGAALQSITGIGPVISAGLLCHFDIREAKTCGHFTNFAGLNPTTKWMSRENTRKEVTRLLAEMGNGNFGDREVIVLYERYAARPRASSGPDFVAAANLLQEYGPNLVRAVIPTLARCHNRDGLFNLNVSNFEKQFGAAVAFYQELCKTHELVESPESQAKLNFNQCRVLADHFGRNPFRLYKQAQGGEDHDQAPTMDRIVSTLCRRPWNAKLKTLIWKAETCFVKFQNHEGDYYGGLYNQRKEIETTKNERGEYAEQAKLILETKKFGKETEARKHYESGKLPPAHIHARAMRWVGKIFISHVHHMMHVDYFGTEPPLPYALTGRVEGDHRHMIPLPVEFPGKFTGKTLQEMWK